MDIQGGEPSLDWRGQLQFGSRQRVVNKIMDTLRKHFPFSGQGGLLELKKFAERFEEKVYTASTNQSDYLRKISLKLIAMETRSKGPAMPNNSGVTCNRAPDPDSPSESVTININGERRVMQDSSSIPVIIQFDGTWVTEGRNWTYDNGRAEILLLSADETYLGLLEKLYYTIPVAKPFFDLCVETSYVSRGVSLHPTVVSNGAKLKAFIAYISDLPVQERIPLCVSLVSRDDE